MFFLFVRKPKSHGQNEREKLLETVLIVLLFKAEQIQNKDASIPMYIVIFSISATFIFYTQL